MSDQIMVDFQHPTNTGILTYLGQPSAGMVLPHGAPAAHPDPYYQLGTHPDLVARLWDEITVFLPRKCQRIINEKPVLVHPSSGIIFGFASGTHTYALRLPPAEHQEARKRGAQRVHVYPGSTCDLESIGAEWVFGQWFQEEARWCLAAYEFAA